MINNLAQNLVFGILVGGIYGLAAVGLSLVFGVTKFLNVSHGELLMVGGYVSYWIFTLLGIDPLVSLPLTVLVMLILGTGLYKLIFSRMVKLNEDDKIKNTMLVGFGLSLVFQNLAIRFWTADERSVATTYSDSAFTLLGIRFPVVGMISLGIALVLLVALDIFLHKSYLGKAIRGTVEDWEASTLMGINIQSIYLVSFGLGTVLAGVAGALVGMGYAISPSIGLSWTLKGLIVMVLGGLGSITGTFVGGIVLGMTESTAAMFIDGSYREIIGLILFLLVLIFRPQGLFGNKEG